MSNRASRLTRVGGGVMLLVGVGCLALGADVALHGAEDPVPASGAANVVEGRVLPPGDAGALTRSPVGEPFLYAQVRIADQPGHNAPHWAGAFGEPEVTLQVASGETAAVTLGAPSEWRVLPDVRERREGIASLTALPIVREVETTDRLNPPYFIDVIAVRPGDSVIVEQAADGSALRTYVGARETHERLHAQRERMRWPMVALLATLAVVSLLGGTRLVRQRPSVSG